MNKHPEFVSLGSLSLQRSSAKHQLLEPYISLTQPHKPSTLVFPGLWRNAGALKVSHPAKCLLAGERTCQCPEGGRRLQEPSNWPPLPQHGPHFRASSTEPGQIFAKVWIRSHHFCDYLLKGFSLSLNDKSSIAGQALRLLPQPALHWLPPHRPPQSTLQTWPLSVRSPSSTFSLSTDLLPASTLEFPLPRPFSLSSSLG